MLSRMLQRRGTAAQWTDVEDTVILAAGEFGLETDTGKFKIGDGVTVWSGLSYFLPDNNPASISSHNGNNNQDTYARLSALSPSYNQTLIGTQILRPQSSSQTPLVVSGIAGQSEVLQRWRNVDNQTLASVDQDGKITALGGGSFGSTVDMDGNKITNLGAPTSSSDATTKQYVDDAIAGLAWKAPVNLISASGLNTYVNVPLTGNTGTVVLDGHSALDSGDDGYRILLLAQTTPSQNGIYVYNDNGTTYTLTRASDSDTYQELIGASVFVSEGTNYGTSSWVQTNHYLTSFSNQSWVQFNGASQITADGGLTKVGNTIAVGAGTGITVNADNVQISDSYAGQTSITTLGTVTTGTWNASTITANNGGTGQSTYSVGDILYADTSSTLNKLIAGTSGYTIISQGTGVAPAYGQIDTPGIKDDAVTYAKMQNVSAQYRVLGRISAGTGNAEEINPDQLMQIINQGNTDIKFDLLPVGTTSTTVAQGDHTHTLDQLSDVTISGTPVQRQVIKYNGTTWINELPSGGISVGDTPPVDASEGDAWFDSTDGSLYVYYNDDIGTPSSQWVQVKANSALEASILTRMSAVEGRATVLEQANAVRVTSQADRDAKFPSPVQGNTVFRSDLGYEEKYYAAYNATTNPDGTRGTPGWYRYAGGAPLSQNYVLNSDMSISQRGTSWTLNTTPTYYLDRWTATAGANITLSQDASDFPSGFTNSIKAVWNATSALRIKHAFERLEVVKLRGKTVTVSAFVKDNATYSGNLEFNVNYSNSTDALASIGTAVVSSAIFTAPTTSWTRSFYTFVVPADAVGLSIDFFAPSQVSGANLLITGVQLEEGPVATPFRRNQPNIQAELAACQRYYYRLAPTIADQHLLDGGIAYTTTAGCVFFKLPMQMRSVPTVTSSNASTFYTWTANGGVTNVSAITPRSDKGSLSMYRVDLTTAGSLSVGQSLILHSNSLSAYLDASAEL